MALVLCLINAHKVIYICACVCSFLTLCGSVPMVYQEASEIK